MKASSPHPRQTAEMEKALHHPFKAAAFDVDGTLTHFARFIIPSFVAETLVGIPEHIPRAICTGRDLDFIQTQLRHICSHSQNPEEELKRWWIFAENGTVGYRWNSKKKDYEVWCEVNWPKEPQQDTLEAFSKDVLGSQGVFILRNHTVVVRHPDWVYLWPRLTRFMSKRSHKKLVNILEKNRWGDSFRVQDSGIGNVILPIEGGKGNAMKRWSKMLKLPIKDILVVGDQAAPGENDEDFLNGHNGTAFSVGTLTENLYPLPVLDHRGRPLSGPEGTATLLKRVEWAKV